MLASEPPSNRVHAGGGISVRVNGTAVEDALNLKSSCTVENRNKIADKSMFGEDAEILAEHTNSSWANATITWRSGAQPYSGGRSDDVSTGKACVLTPPTMVNDTPATSEREPHPAQLVHVIRVQAITPGLQEPKTNPVMSEMSKESDYTESITPAHVRVTAPKESYYSSMVGNDKSNEKVSVVVGSSLNRVVKGEDERSSSGASSAPGSDCERSDSDHEGDDGTDSGFSSSRRPCASIMVRAKNSTNVSNNFKPCDIAVNGTGSVLAVCDDRRNVKLTIASYVDKDSVDPSLVQGNDFWDMQFHLHELEKRASEKKSDNEDAQTKISAAHALLTGHSGMNTMKNRVRSSIVSLLVQSNSNRNYDQEETGRVVFYTTSMGVVRTTFDRCRKVRKILETLMIKFEEKDVFMNRGFQQEIRERLGSSRVIVPQVFMEGRHLGGAEIVEQLNEIGHLRKLLRTYKRQSVGGTCQQCGGYRYLLCAVCGGSKKSVTHRHHFSEDLVALRCVTCDESGLIRCPQCINGDG